MLDKIRIPARPDYFSGEAVKTMAFAFLWRWLMRAPLQRPDLHVVLFTRASCPLCDEACDVLLRHQLQYGFVLETKNVDASAEWLRDFGASVPVVAINGTVRFRGHVNEVLLRRMLDAPPGSPRQSDCGTPPKLRQMYQVPIER